MNLPDLPPPAHDPATLLAEPAFAGCLQAAVGDLLATHARIPHEVRYLADLKKWMLSQAALSLHFAHGRDPGQPPLSPGSLLDLLRHTPVASRNTILAFLQEMRHYNLVTPLPDADRRRRNLRATAHAEALIAIWFETHLRALDLVDAADRAALLRRRPELLAHAQPLMTRRLLHDPAWTLPPEPVALFTRTASGSNILHHLAVRAPWRIAGDWVEIGPVTAQAIAEHYLISASHTGRLLARAADAGLLRWQGAGRRGGCALAAGLVEDYRRWQAVKFAALSGAVAAAVEQAAPQGGPQDVHSSIV